MKRSPSPLVAFGLAIALAGCSTAHRAYQFVPTGETAFLRVISSDGSSLPGNVFISTFDEPQSCRGRYFLQGIPSQMQPTNVTLSFATIPASKPFTLAINAPAGGSFSGGFAFCAPMAMFTPQPGQYYTARIGVNPQSGCYLSIVSAPSASDQLGKAVQFKPKRFSNGLDEESSFCKAD